MMGISTLVDTQISPNGAQVLYVRSTPDLATNSYRTEIWTVPANGGAPRQLTVGKHDDSPRWSSDAQQIGFISDRDGKRQVWVINAEGREAKQLTHSKTGVTSFDWSPDGRTIAFLAPDAEQVSKDPVIVRIEDQKYTMSHIHLLDLATKKERQLTRGGYSIDDFSWSPDSQEIAFTYRPTPRVLDDYKTDVYLVRVKDGDVRPLVKRPGRDDSPKWSPDGSQIAFLSTDGGLNELHSVYVFVVSAAGGEPRNVSSNIGERVYGLYGWSSDGRDLYYRVRQGVTMQLLAASTETGRAHVVTNGEKVYDSFSFSRDSRKMAFVATDANHPKDLFVSSPRDFAAVPLVTSNPQISAFPALYSELVRWKSSDGLEVEGILDLPSKYDVGKRYPLVTIIHGGPAGGFTIGFAPQLSAIPVPLTMDVYFPQLFAEHGYAVFMPNIRGGGGYGEKFRNANVPDWGGADFADMMTGIDALIDRGIADGDKLALMGWSYGGYMTAWAISQTTRFKAASVGAGVSDMTSMYGTCEAPDQIEPYFAGPPWQQQLYEARSAITFASHIKTPTLIQHGERDSAVPVEQARELYRALSEQRVPVELTIYPRSGHDPEEPLQSKDIWTRNLEWLDRWVMRSGH